MMHKIISKPKAKIYVWVLWTLWFIIPAQAQVIYTFEPAGCKFNLPEEQVVECGYLIVPEDYSHPASEVRLAVTIFRHPDGNPQPDPIIYLEGGPGGSALEFVEYTFPVRYQPLFATNRDIIVFDQRGIGLSSPVLDCRQHTARMLDLLDLDYQGVNVTRAESDVLLAESLMACGMNLAAQHNLSQYNSAVSARDVENLRLALGYDRVNLWGISYGTRLALTVMRDYPDSVRSVVLDSTYPLEVNLYTDTPASWVRALNTLFAACEQDAPCNTTFPDLRQTYFDTVDALNKNPQRINVLHPVTGEQLTDVVIDGVQFQRIVFDLLYDTMSIPRLPYMIEQARAGDVQAFAIGIRRTILLQEVISYGVYYAIQCQEELAFTERGTVQAAHAAQRDLQSAYPENIDTALFSICDSFNAGQPLSVANDAVVSDIPTLILAGHFDPITPPQWGQMVHANLANSTYVELPTIGHGGSSHDVCAQRLVIDFFAIPQTPLDFTCVDSMRLQFDGVNTPPLDAAPMM